ncbi:MAG TPA: phosphoribosyltransferase family protein [Candidatus Nanoarchaeia archaeon]|nr:phosphoribosyltransferase family protein [Candidatus Nanoarchaeia archaeon]
MTNLYPFLLDRDNPRDLRETPLSPPERYRMAEEYRQFIDQIIASNIEIEARTWRIREVLKKEYKDATTEPKNRVIVIPILEGASNFYNGLFRTKPTFHHRAISLTSKSYNNSTQTGDLNLNQDNLKEIAESIPGERVIIVEDIIDTGNTLKGIVDILQSLNPKDMKIVSLLTKPDRHESKNLEALLPHIASIGFIIPNLFVIGYGLDAGGFLREFPHLATLSKYSIKKLIKK